MLKLLPKPLLNKPATPSLIEKLDQLTYHYNEANRLRKEVEAEWIELNRADQARFQIIQKGMLLRKQETEANKPAKRNASEKTPSVRRTPAWKQLVFEE